MSAKRWLARLIPWVLLVLIPWLLFRDLDWRALGAALRASKWGWVAAAGALSLFPITLLRGMRFLTMVRQLPREEGFPRPGISRIISIMVATRVLNLVLPAKAGETLRALQLKRSFGFAPESVIAAVAMESLFEALALAIPAALLLPLNAGLLPIVLIAAAGVALALVVAGGRRAHAVHAGGDAGGHAAALSAGGNTRLGRMIERFRGSVALLHGRTLWAKLLGLSCSADAFDVAMIGLCLSAVGIHGLGPIHWFMILIAVNIAIAVPTPGNIGTLEAGAVLALGAMGIDRSQALAFALLYHAAHLIPVTLLGMACLRREAAALSSG